MATSDGVDVAAIRDDSPLIATDAAKLRTLADWFDMRDDREGFTGEREVQADLRRIARGVEAAPARLAVAEQQRDDALAKIARVEALLDGWPDGNERASEFAAARGQCKRAIRAALTDPRPTSNAPTWCMTAGHEDVPADVEGTLLGADPPITGIRYCRECADVMGDDFRADPRPPSATPTAETVPPRVAGTGGSAQ